MWVEQNDVQCYTSMWQLGEYRGVYLPIPFLPSKSTIETL